jgi:hypothetical protein
VTVKEHPSGGASGVVLIEMDVSILSPSAGEQNDTIIRMKMRTGRYAGRHKYVIELLSISGFMN